jgi:transcription initiation factor IIF auxiliary subunit
MTSFLVSWVEAPPQILGSIKNVIYYLHPSFTPSQVTTDLAQDKFAYEFAAWGMFDLKAKVNYKDGQYKEISRYISFPGENMGVRTYQ